jgi:hypothetical protein
MGQNRVKRVCGIIKYVPARYRYLLCIRRYLNYRRMDGVLAFFSVPYLLIEISWLYA